MDYLDPDAHGPQKAVKVAEDDIAFKLAIFFLNHCIWTTIHASVVSFKRQN